MFDSIPLELVEAIGIAICFIVVLVAIKNQEPPFSQRINHDKAEAQKAEAYRSKQAYRSSHPLTEEQKQTRLLRNLFWLTFFTRRR